MRKLYVLCLLVPMFLSSQEISLYGNHGMFKLQYAKPHDMGMLSFHIAPEWRYESFDVTVDGGATTDRKHFFDLNNGISYSILDYWEMRFRTSLFMKYYETNDFPVRRDDPYPPAGFKTLEIGTKIGRPIYVDRITPMYYAFGIDACVDLGPTLSDNGLITDALVHDSMYYADSFYGIAPNFPPYVPHSPDYGFTGLFDFRVGAFATHLNVGYLMTGEDQRPSYVTEDDFSSMIRPNYLTHGLGIELIPSDAFRVLFEVYGMFDSDASSESLWVTPGLRFGSQTVSFDLGCEFGIQGTSYFKPFFNFSAGIDLFKKVEVRMPVANVTGRVYDAASGEPLLATITFPGSKKAAVQTLPDGTYKTTFTPGIYRFHVDAADHRWKEQGILLKDGDQLILDYPLNKIEIAQATITGKVSDIEDGKPLLAKLSFVDGKTYTIQTDPTTGIYKTTVRPGTYSVKVEVEDYLLESMPIVLSKLEVKIQNFKMRRIPKVGETVVFRGINFDFNSSIIKPESYPVLDDAARILKARPKMRVEIGGHTDSIGSDSYNRTLSFERAQAVKDYLIRYHKIESNRIEVRGYGEAQPVADNRTKTGRDLNRRIEFKVLSME